MTASGVDPATRLSDHQTLILLRTALGDTNEQMARALHLSVETVGGHLRLTYRALDARSRAHAVTRGLTAGVIALRAGRVLGRQTGDGLLHTVRCASWRTLVACDCHREVAYLVRGVDPGDHVLSCGIHWVTDAELRSGVDVADLCSYASAALDVHDVGPDPDGWRDARLSDEGRWSA